MVQLFIIQENSVFCRRHLPLKLKKSLEARKRKTKDELIDFIKNTEKLRNHQLECSLFKKNTYKFFRNNNKKRIKIKLNKINNNQFISNDFIIKLKKNDEGNYDFDESLPKVLLKKNNPNLKYKFIRKTKHSNDDYNKKLLLEEKMENFVEKKIEQSAPQTTLDKLSSSPESFNQISIKLDHNRENNNIEKSKILKILEEPEKVEIFDNFKVPLCICKSFWDTKEDMICNNTHNLF